MQTCARVSVVRALALVLVVVVGRSTARGGAGDLDPTFGTNGIATVDFAAFYDYASGLALQPDGKVLLAGQAWNGSKYDFGVARLLPDGTPDPLFGAAGRISTNFGLMDGASSVVVQPDGKIVAAGASEPYNNYRFALARYDASGMLDPTFGTGGMVTTDLGPNHDGIADVVLQPDGKIVAAGYRENGNVGGSSNYSFALARYNPDGTLDATFGSGGIVLTKIGPTIDTAHALVLQPDGRIVVAGDTSSSGDTDWAVVRYLPNGALDPSFGSGGTVITSFGFATDVPRDVLLQPDGKLVACGSARLGSVIYVGLARYTASGALDPTFGMSGKVTTRVGVADAVGNAIMRQPDGKLVVVGPAKTAADSEWGVTRFLPDGTLDTSFGSGGAVVLPTSSGEDIPYDVEWLPDARILVAGRGFTAATWYDFAAARLLAGAVCGDGVLQDGEQCDDANTQDGDCCSASCQLSAPGGACADDGDACTADTCSAAAVCEHSLRAAGAVCRPAAGACDLPEACDGVWSACPADGFVAAGQGCRAAAGACDVAETCTGTGPACPADGFVASGTVCRGSAGACDVVERCSGSAAACPADVKSTAVCRAAAGPCDVAEACDGAGDDCPADGFVAAGQECRAGAGACDVPETCSGSSAVCPADVKSTAVCRAAAGPCDVAESCDGAGDDCPVDGFVAAGQECRGAAGACDVAETCSGSSAACPADAKSTAVCRAAAGACDVAESCNGVSDTCPADAFAPATQVCRAAAGACDLAETCTGTQAACPANAVVPDGDGDGRCDAVDPCTNPGGANTFVLTNPVPKIVLNRINTDTTPGNDHLSMVGAFFLPVGKSFADLDPAVNGARVVLTNRTGAVELDATIAGGIYNGAGTRGWKLTNQGKTWTFTDSTTTPSGGIVKVILYDRSSNTPRRVEVSITGDDSTYPVVFGDEPVDGVITLGGQAQATAGLCGETDFLAADCFWNSGRDQLTCKK